MANQKSHEKNAQEEETVSESKKTKQTLRHTQKALNKLARFTANSPIPSILLITSILFARYLPNSDFSYPTEMVLPILMFAVLSIVIFYIYRRIFKGNSFTANLATCLLIYAIYGFNYAFPYVRKWTDAILPSSLTTSFSSAAIRILLLAIIFGAIAYAVTKAIRHIKPLHHLQPYKVLLFAVCFIFAVQAFKVGGRLWQIADQWSYHPVATLPAKPATTPSIFMEDTNPDGTKSSAGQTVTKPNVYYILFDRYASTETLQNVYKFDNTPMLDFFTGKGFVNRQPAYANYPFTQQSISSTFSMSYLTDLEQRFKGDAKDFQTAFPYRSIISDPPIANAFQQNGYRYNQVSSWWDFSRVGVKADNDPVKSFRLRILGMTFWLTDLQRDIFHKSAFSPILQKGLTIGNLSLVKYDQDRNPRQNFEDQVEAVRTIAKDSRTQKQPQFTFAHILSPHDPYVFAADGSDAKYNGDRTDQDIDEYVKYTNQLTYANKRLRDMITTIRQEDPRAVIVFQPDEGPYPKEFRGALTAKNYFDPKNLNDTSLKHKFGITASYYMPGIDSDTVSKELDTSVNAFPFVLNHYLGYDIKYLPDCNFSAGNKFTLYDYTLLNGRLQDNPDFEDCKQFDR